MSTADMMMMMMLLLATLIVVSSLVPLLIWRDVGMGFKFRVKGFDAW